MHKRFQGPHPLSFLHHFAHLYPLRNNYPTTWTTSQHHWFHLSSDFILGVHLLHFLPSLPCLLFFTSIVNFLLSHSRPYSLTEFLRCTTVLAFSRKPYWTLKLFFLVNHLDSYLISCLAVITTLFSLSQWVSIQSIVTISLTYSSSESTSSRLHSSRIAVSIANTDIAFSFQW